MKEWHLVIDNLCEEMYNSNKVMIVLQTSKSDFDRQGLLYLMDSDSICYFQQKGNKILIDKLGTKLSEIKKFVLYTKGDFRTLQNSIAKTNNIIVNDAPNLDFFLYDKYNMDLSWFYSFEYNSKIFELETLDTLK